MRHNVTRLVLILSCFLHRIVSDLTFQRAARAAHLRDELHHASCRIQSERWRRQVQHRLQPGRSQRWRGLPNVAGRSRPQANATYYLTGLANDDIPAGIADFFRQTLCATPEGKKNRVAITETRYPNLHLITASPDLAELQSKLESKFKINKLRKLLVALSDDYERIYIDTPPALNFYTFSAMLAAERLLIPFDCDSFSRQALLSVMAEVEELRQTTTPRCTSKGSWSTSSPHARRCTRRWSTSCALKACRCCRCT